MKGFLCGSIDKESACNAGDSNSIPGLERSTVEGKKLPTWVFWPGELHGLYSPWGHKESERTERLSLFLGFSGSSVRKESACNTGDGGLIPGLGRSPGEGNHNPLQYSCLGNSMNRGAWWATVHRTAKSRTFQSDWAHTQLAYRLLAVFPGH